MAKTKTVTTGQQVTRFGVVGVMNTAIDYTIYIALTKLFAIPLDRVWTAKLVSGSVAMINSFYFNRRFVFHGISRRRASRQFARFVVATVVAVYVIQLGLVQLFSSNFPQVGELFYLVARAVGLTRLAPHQLTEAFTIKTVAFGLATAASLVWNFLLYKLWAFKE